MSILEHTREDLLLPNMNGIETSVALAEEGNPFTGERYMRRETVKWIFEQLNESGIPYAIIGGLAIAYYATPRMTKDLDILVLDEDRPRLHRLFAKYFVLKIADFSSFLFSGLKRMLLQPDCLTSVRRCKTLLMQPMKVCLSKSFTLATSFCLNSTLLGSDETYLKPIKTEPTSAMCFISFATNSLLTTFATLLSNCAPAIKRLKSWRNGGNELSGSTKSWGRWGWGITLSA